MQIDPQTGAVTLPDAARVDSELAQDAFRAGAVFPRSQAESYGTPPWIHYRFSGGALEGHPLLVSLCFYDQLLVTVTLAADLYPPGPKDWSNYSLDVEADTKAFHDRLLEQALGPPTRAERLPAGSLTAAQPTLARPLAWDFPWGRVHSSHDFKGGGTSIIVQYGNRHEEASRDYLSRRSPQR